MQDKDKDKDQLLTAGQVARLTKISTRTLAVWRHERKNLAFVKLNSRNVRYRKSDVDKFISDRLVHEIRETVELD